MYIHRGGEGEEGARARVYPLAIKDGETLFKPDTPPLEIRPCSATTKIPSVEHNRYSHETTRRVPTLRRLISSGRLKTNGSTQ